MLKWKLLFNSRVFPMHAFAARPNVVYVGKLSVRLSVAPSKRAETEEGGGGG